MVDKMKDKGAKPYSAPKLTVHGNVAALTAAGSTGRDENSGNSPNRKK